MGSVERPVERLWAVPDPNWKFCGPSAATVLAGLPQQAPIHDYAFSTGRQSRTDYSFFCTKHVRGRVPVTDCPMYYRARKLFRSEKAESRKQIEGCKGRISRHPHDTTRRNANGKAEVPKVFANRLLQAASKSAPSSFCRSSQKISNLRSKPRLALICHKILNFCVRPNTEHAQTVSSELMGRSPSHIESGAVCVGFPAI